MEFYGSYTGYLLARLLNASSHLVWWHRLCPQDGVCVYHNPKDQHFPDFVALDDESAHWIIEGKDKRGHTDERMQAKRRAAEIVVHRLVGTKRFSGDKWGHLITYEDDIVKADSWDDLKEKFEPVSNA